MNAITKQIIRTEINYLTDALQQIVDSINHYQQAITKEQKRKVEIEQSLEELKTDLNKGE